MENKFKFHAVAIIITLGLVSSKTLISEETIEEDFEGGFGLYWSTNVTSNGSYWSTPLNGNLPIGPRPPSPNNDFIEVIPINSTYWGGMASLKSLSTKFNPKAELELTYWISYAPGAGRAVSLVVYTWADEKSRNKTSVYTANFNSSGPFESWITQTIDLGVTEPSTFQLEITGSRPYDQSTGIAILKTKIRNFAATTTLTSAIDISTTTSNLSTTTTSKSTSPEENSVFTVQGSTLAFLTTTYSGTVITVTQASTEIGTTAETYEIMSTEQITTSSKYTTESSEAANEITSSEKITLSTEFTMDSSGEVASETPSTEQITLSTEFTTDSSGEVASETPSTEQITLSTEFTTDSSGEAAFETSSTEQITLSIEFTTGNSTESSHKITSSTEGTTASNGYTTDNNTEASHKITSTEQVTTSTDSANTSETTSNTTAPLSQGLILGLSIGLSILVALSLLGCILLWLCFIRPKRTPRLSARALVSMAMLALEAPPKKHALAYAPKCNLALDEPATLGNEKSQLQSVSEKDSIEKSSTRSVSTSEASTSDTLSTLPLSQALEKHTFVNIPNSVVYVSETYTPSFYHFRIPRPQVYSVLPYLRVHIPHAHRKQV